MNFKVSTIAICTALAAVMASSCGTTKTAARPQTKIITIDSEPRGAKVVYNGQILCERTPAQVSIPLTYQLDQSGFKSPGKRKESVAKINTKELLFILDGYENGVESFRPTLSNNFDFTYPDGVFHIFTPRKAVQQPTLAQGQVVTRENPGATSMENTIIRWFFDSDPRGARIFWRVISSVPAEVKNTNETYLTTTPYEETRGFNIIGLTPQNAKDVTIEIKVQKRGYEDQVKRFNVRQALDQQEISGFFELVPKE